MIVTPAQHQFDLGKNAPGYQRTPGLHMSDLYGALYAALEPKRYDPATPLPLEKLELGMVWEEALEEGLKRRLTGDQRPGEFITLHDPKCPSYVDYGTDYPNPARGEGSIVPCQCGAGIIYSPDLLIFEDDDTILGEIKLTWMSIGGPKSRNRVPVTKAQAEAAGRPDLANDITDFPPKFGKWFTQIACYLYHLKLTRARLIVFFVNGNYAPPSPVPLAWNVQFTPRELEEEWLAVKNHAIATGKL